MFWMKGEFERKLSRPVGMKFTNSDGNFTGN